uniref:Uncharacterized protein n=1 Tax=Corethron hystrix TaxID=216773 RepID=A0A7S1FMC5_9STRA
MSPPLSLSRRRRRLVVLRPCLWVALTLALLSSATVCASLVAAPLRSIGSRDVVRTYYVRLTKEEKTNQNDKKAKNDKNDKNDKNKNKDNNKDNNKNTDKNQTEVEPATVPLPLSPPVPPPTPHPTSPPTSFPTSPPTFSPVSLATPNPTPALPTLPALPALPARLSSDPTAAPLLIYFSPFSLRILVDPDSPLPPNDALAARTRLYLDARCRQTIDPKVRFRRLTFRAVCTPAPASLDCHLTQTLVWLDPASAIPSPRELNVLVSHAFTGDGAGDYLAFLGEDPALDAIRGVVYDPVAATKEVPEAKAAEPLAARKNNNTLAYAAGALFGVGGSAVAALLSRRARERTRAQERAQRAAEPEIVVDAQDRRHMEDVSDMSMSIVTVSTRHLPQHQQVKGFS